MGGGGNQPRLEKVSWSGEKAWEGGGGNATRPREIEADLKTYAGCKIRVQMAAVSLRGRSWSLISMIIQWSLVFSSDFDLSWTDYS